MGDYERRFHEEYRKRFDAEQALARANEIVTNFRDFIRSRDLDRDFLEFFLTRRLGDALGAKVIADSFGPPKSNPTPGPEHANPHPSATPGSEGEAHL